MAREEFISVALQSSRLLGIIYWAIHFIAAALVACYPAILPVKAIAFALVATSAIVGQHRLKQQAAVARLQLSRERNFIWFDDRKSECEVIGNPFVSHVLTTLSLRLCGFGQRRGRTFHLLLLPDSATRDELRRLRVFLLTVFKQH